MPRRPFSTRSPGSALLSDICWLKPRKYRVPLTVAQTPLRIVYQGDFAATSETGAWSMTAPRESTSVSWPFSMRTWPCWASGFNPRPICTFRATKPCGAEYP